LNVLHLMRIAAHHGVNLQELMKWEGTPVMQFREEVICGGLMTQMTG